MEFNYDNPHDSYVTSIGDTALLPCALDLLR